MVCPTKVNSIGPSCTICQASAFIAGIQGVTTGNNNAVPVLIDSNGQLGTVSSSRRYKEDIQDMADASSGLLRLRPVRFRYKKPFADGSQPVQYGLVAAGVPEVYPDLVARSANGQMETVKYQVLGSMLLTNYRSRRNRFDRWKSGWRESRRHSNEAQWPLRRASRPRHAMIA